MGSGILNLSQTTNIFPSQGAPSDRACESRSQYPQEKHTLPEWLSQTHALGRALGEVWLE